jgi:hypothetical protein
MHQCCVDATAADGGGGVSQLFAPGVRHLDPEQATSMAMLDGWATQQRARLLKASTIQARHYVIRRLAAYTNDYPWQWSATDAEEFMVHVASSTRASTVRGYQAALRLFMSYLIDPHYEWIGLCERRFGAAPRQVLHDWNAYTHVTEFEGNPSRRPLTYHEVQALFDAADGHVGTIPDGTRRCARCYARHGPRSAASAVTRVVSLVVILLALPSAQVAINATAVDGSRVRTAGRPNTSRRGLPRPLCGDCRPLRPFDCANCGKESKIARLATDDGPVCGACYARTRRFEAVH